MALRCRLVRCMTRPIRCSRGGCVAHAIAPQGRPRTLADARGPGRNASTRSRRTRLARPARGSRRRRSVAVPAGAARRRLSNPAGERMDVRLDIAHRGGDSRKTVAQSDILAKPANSTSASAPSSPAWPTARALRTPSERCWQGWSSPAHGWGRESSGRSLRSAIRSRRSSRRELLLLVRVDDRAQ